MRILFSGVFGAFVFLAWGAEASALNIGSKEQAQWSETTVKAATSPDQQAVLNQGKVTTVTGEILDASCYLQLDKRGPAHIACGAGCIRRGQPVGVLTDDGQLYLIVAEEHDPRRGGLVSIREYFADRVGQTATVTGLAIERDGTKALFIAGAPLTPSFSETQ